MQAITFSFPTNSIPLTKVVFKAIETTINTSLNHFDWSNLLIGSKTI